MGGRRRAHLDVSWLEGAEVDVDDEDDDELPPMGRRFFYYLFDHVRQKAWKAWVLATPARYLMPQRYRNPQGKVKTLNPVESFPYCLGPVEIHFNDLDMYPDRKKLDYDKALELAYPAEWEFRTRKRK